MSPNAAIILFVIGAVLFLVGLFLSFKSSQAQKTFEEAKNKLDDERSDLERRANSKSSAPKQQAAKSAPAETVVQDDELKKQLDKTREKLSKQREKNQHITRERDELKKEVSDLRSEIKNPPKNANALVDLRMELAEAKQDALRYKEQLEDYKSYASTRKAEKVEPKEEPKPKKEVKPEPVVVASSSEDASEHQAIVASLKGQLKDLEQQLRDQDKDLRHKLKKQGRDIEKQMRRADNNDKAYRITQKELDAARERINMLSDQLERARFALTTTSSVPAATQETPAVVEEEEALIVAPETAVVEAPVEEKVEQHEEAPVEEAVIEEAPADEQVATEEETEAPVVEETAVDEQVAVEEAPEETPEEVVAPEATPADSEEEAKKKNADTVVDLIEHQPSGLSEVSAVDEAWGDIDLEDDEF